MPGRVDACRCGAPRADAALPADPAHSASPTQPALPAAQSLGAIGFTIRIVLAIAVFGGLGAGWYLWTKDAAKDQQASMAKTAAAVAKRVQKNSTIELKDAGTPATAGNQPIPQPALPQAAPPQAAFPAPAQPAPVAAPAGLLPLEDLVARVSPAVVLVDSSIGRGSAFFVQPDTLITNAHVVGSDISVRVRRSNGETSNARVERAASDLDLAVLKISAPASNQVVLSMGDAAHVRSGEEVIAIGSPAGTFQNSVTRGIVSAVRQVDQITMIQTDAAINGGNSGGPMLDRSGTVIGINTYGWRGTQGIAFAIAVDHARDVLSGQHITSTSATPLSALNEFGTGRSEPERAKLSASYRYEEAIAKLARRADSLDQEWDRFRRECYRGPVNSSFSRGWFSVFDGKAVENVMVPGCGSFFNDIRSEAFTIKNTIEAMDEEARKQNVLPGTQRGVRQKYRLDYAGWDR